MVNLIDAAGNIIEVLEEWFARDLAKAGKAKFAGRVNGTPRMSLTEELVFPERDTSSPDGDKPHTYTLGDYAGQVYITKERLTGGSQCHAFIDRSISKYERNVHAHPLKLPKFDRDQPGGFDSVYVEARAKHPTRGEVRVGRSGVTRLNHTLHCLEGSGGGGGGSSPERIKSLGLEFVNVTPSVLELRPAAA